MSSNLESILRSIEQNDLDRLFRELGSHSLNLDQLVGGKLAMVEAVKQGPKFVSALVTHGASVNAKDRREMTPLLQATALGVPCLVQQLIDYGADPNLSQRGVACPLTQAAMRRSPEMLEIATILIQAGADVDFVARTPKGEPTISVLMTALEARNCEVATLLIAHGANVKQVMALGTPLTSAVQGGDKHLVALLLERGADSNVSVPETSFDRKIAGKSPIELATISKRPDIVSLLGGHSTWLEPTTTDANATDLWKSVAKKLHPQQLKTFRPPVSQSDATLLANTIGRPIPLQLADFLSIHDGQIDSESAYLFENDGQFEDCFRILSATEMAKEWIMWNKLLQSGEFSHRGALSDAGIRTDWYNSGWIPFASNGTGDNYCIDLDPASGGTFGQVLLLRHDAVGRVRMADDFLRWLSNSVD